MNKALSASLTAVVLLGILAPSNVSAATGFTDVLDTMPNSPYINELVSKKVLEGVDAARFDPDAPLTREQFAKMVVLAFGLKADSTAEAPFTDVTNDWAKPYVAAAYHHKLIEGAGQNQFEPSAPLSRQAAASIVWRYLERSGAVQASAGSQLQEGTDADSWAKSAVSGVMRHGLRTEGKSVVAYRSKDVMTRGDAAALIALSLKLVESKQQAEEAAPKPQEKLQEKLQEKPKKQTVPSGNGESKEQAIYYELGAAVESTTKGKTTFYRIDLESNRSVLFNMENVERMLVYDDKGQFISLNSSPKFIFDPPQRGTYFLVVEADLNLPSIFSAFNGMTMQQAIDMEQFSGIRLSLAANQDMFFSIKLLKGSTYLIETVNPTNDLANLTFYTEKGTLAEKSSGNGPFQFVPQESGTYYIKVSSGVSDTVFGLKIGEMGVSKVTAIAIGAGNTEALISQNGVTWLQLMLPPDKNYELKIEGALSHELILNSVDRRETITMNQTPWSSETITIGVLDPSFYNNYALRLVGAPGSTAKVAYYDGKSVSGALHLSLDNSGMGKSNGAIVKIGDDRSTFYQINLETGKKYEFWSTDAAQGDSPSPHNDDITKQEDYSIKRDYVTELILLDSNSVKQEAASKDGKLTFTPTQTGVYYINFKPGMNSRGYYLNAAMK